MIFITHNYVFLGIDSDEAQIDFLRKRQHISTIETRNSPTRSLLQHGPGGAYPGYCTLRNGGLPLHDLSNIPTKHNIQVRVRSVTTMNSLPRNSPGKVYEAKKVRVNYYTN